MEQTLLRTCTFVKQNNIDAKKHSKTLKHGDMTIVSKNKFISNLNTHFHFEKWKDSINWSKYNVAGGCLLKCILQKTFVTSTKQDIDLFYSFENLNEKALHEAYSCQFAERMRTKGFDVIYICEKPHNKLGHIIDIFVNFEEVRTEATIEVPKAVERNIPDMFTKFQFILLYDEYLSYETLLKSADLNEYINEFDTDWYTQQDLEKKGFSNDDIIKFRNLLQNKDQMLMKSLHCDNIISGFDIDACQIRFDGENVFGTFAFVFAVSSMTCISYKLPKDFDGIKQHWFSMHRAIKYSNRGLRLLIPRECEFDICRGPLNVDVVNKWYNKYYIHLEEYGPIKHRNYDYIGVLKKFKSIIIDSTDNDSVYSKNMSINSHVESSDYSDNFEGSTDLFDNDFIKYGLLHPILRSKVADLIKVDFNDKEINKICILKHAEQFDWLHQGSTLNH
eukprot:174388_1